MLLPSIFGQDLFGDFERVFDFPRVRMPESRGVSYGKPQGGLMKTDIRESDEGYHLDIDLPGFKKDGISAELKDGYLTVSASQESSSEEKDENGSFIRRERYMGNMSRSFFVGEDVTEEDIDAKYEDGILKLFVPKVEPKKPEDTKRLVKIA